MSVRFAINGLGRIGRALLRVAHLRPGLEVVAANDPADARRLGRLIARETLRGVFPGQVRRADDRVEIDGRSIPIYDRTDPAAVPWEETAPEIVVEASGRFSHREQAAQHLRGPVERVVVSANGTQMDLTICLGVNHELFDPTRHRVISNTSCTTNCVASVLSVLHREFGLARGLLNTVHCYNSNQSLVDAPHADARRARAAAVNMIPTTTGAVAAVAQVLPELSGRIAGFAVRVPTPDVSLVDLTVELESRPTQGELAAAFRHAAADRLAGILTVTDEELVSSDFLGDPHSAIVDLPLLQAVDDRLFRIVAWYDNEWGYANRLADLLELIGGKGDESAATPGGESYQGIENDDRKETAQ